MSTMESATVNIPFEVVDGMREKIRKLELEAVDLRNKLADQQLMAAGDNGIAFALRAALRDALPIIQFAQGNLDPETVRNWPHRELARLAHAVSKMPGATEHEREWAHDAVKFCEFASTIDEARRQGRQAELAKVPRAALGSDTYAAQANALLQKTADKKPPDDDSNK